MSSGTLEIIWKKRAHGGVMDRVDVATLETDKGMVGDANYRAGRQITVISRDAWDDVEAALGASVDPSARRANFLVRGVPLEETRGQILEIGDCRIEIRGETRPCELMDKAHEGLREQLADHWRGGVHGRVLQGGEVRVGDPVRWAPSREGSDT